MTPTKSGLALIGIGFVGGLFHQDWAGMVVIIGLLLVVLDNT